MDERPELIAFSQYKLGGIQSYFHNLLANDPFQKFEKKWIFYNDDLDDAAKLPGLYNCCNETIFQINEFAEETNYNIASKLKDHISNRDGIVLSSFHYELMTLHLYRRRNKTIFFICHDKGYLNNARRFEFLIDVFIAHNIQFFDEMRLLFPNRVKDIYYLPHGVTICDLVKSVNKSGTLRIVVLSRMDKEKGVWDIPAIEDTLKKRGKYVEWTIIGDGPEKIPLKKHLDSYGNFKFASPADNKTVMELVKQCDVFVLPSRLDGMPVALFETMSAGCVPIISEFNYGIKRVVTPKEGFVLPVGDIDKFADTIAELDGNRELLENLSHAARNKIEQEYDIKERVKDYYLLFNKYKKLRHSRRFRFHKYSGWLDYPFIPLTLRKFIRRVKQRIV